MANLDEQLKYFIHVKLTTDPLWSGVDIHLSGHLVRTKHSQFFASSFSCRHQAKVNTKSWSTFAIRARNRDTMLTQDIACTASMLIWYARRVDLPNGEGEGKTVCLDHARLGDA